MQVVDVDMNRDDGCPGTWQKITNPKRLCMGLSSAGCASANFDVKGVSYDNICGQAKAYQKGPPDAFESKKLDIIIIRYGQLLYNNNNSTFEHYQLL